MNSKQAKKIRQVARKNLTQTVRTFYDHALSKCPFWMPRFIWKRILYWIISL